MGHSDTTLNHKMKFLFVLCGLMGVCLLSCTAQINAGSGLVEIRDGNQAKLFGGYTTRTRLSTLTSTMLYTCASALAQAAVCGGKRKKRAAVMSDLQNAAVEIEELSSSQHNIEERSADEDTKGKLFIALTSFTTLTTTQYLVNSATTVSISYSCLPLGGTIPPLCG